jgi:hypothetical protein
MIIRYRYNLNLIIKYHVLKKIRNYEVFRRRNICIFYNTLYCGLKMKTWARKTSCFKNVNKNPTIYVDNNTTHQDFYSSYRDVIGQTLLLVTVTFKRFQAIFTLVIQFKYHNEL